MTLVKLNQPQLDNVFSNEKWLNEFLGNSFALNNSSDLNYFINDKELNVEMEIPVPGLTKEDLEIVLENDFVTIKTINNEKTQKSNWTKQFEKKFKLSDKINAEEIKASVENGVLKIDFPKAAKELKKEAKNIDIS